MLSHVVGRGLDMAEFLGSGGGGGLFGSILERGDSKLFRMLSPRFWVGYLVKWRTHLTSAAARAVHTGGNGVEMVACVVWGGLVGLLDVILERGDSELFKMLSPKFWVGCLVKWRRYLTSAARVVHTGGNGVEMVACMALGVRGGLFDIILERGDSKLFKMLSLRFWVGCLVKREDI